MEIYTCSFSSYFEDKSFTDAALSVAIFETDFKHLFSICFKLGVLLIAVESDDEISNEKEIMINPGSQFTIKMMSTRGFVLASSSEEAKRIKFFCGQCHARGEALIIPGRRPCLHIQRESLAKLPKNPREQMLLPEVNHPSAIKHYHRFTFIVLNKKVVDYIRKFFSLDLKVKDSFAKRQLSDKKTSGKVNDFGGATSPARKPG
ncbi:hypothetical protein ACOME3_005907 [Neoechinorhynchus agilis]